MEKHKHRWFLTHDYIDGDLEEILKCSICKTKRDKPKNWKPKPFKPIKVGKHTFTDLDKIEVPKSGSYNTVSAGY